MNRYHTKISLPRWRQIAIALLPGLIPALAFAGEGISSHTSLDLTNTWFGIASVIIFVVAYLLVMCEEFIHLRKSKPVIVAAGIIWTLVGIAYAMQGDTETAEQAECW